MKLMTQGTNDVYLGRNPRSTITNQVLKTKHGVGPLVPDIPLKCNTNPKLLRLRETMMMILFCRPKQFSCLEARFSLKVCVQFPFYVRSS